MSCADVCIDMDYDSDQNDFFAECWRVARKEHKCCECKRTIKPGERYEYVSGKNDGMWQAKTCAECAEIRKALVCGSWVYGQLWEEIREGVFPAWKELSPLDCLAKIDALAARDALRAGYAEWLEDAR